MCKLSELNNKSDFDPFRNRLCRDVRNQLSSSLLETIHTKNITPSRRVADSFLARGVDSCIQQYINHRLARYKTVIDQMLSAEIASDEIYLVALLLWDQRLFFEVHEWLEQKWLLSVGSEKKILQALIRAAGTYLLLEYDRIKGARKTAEKAVEGLRLYRENIPSFFHVSVLINKLKSLDPAPPLLGAKEVVGKIHDSMRGRQ